MRHLTRGQVVLLGIGGLALGLSAILGYAMSRGVGQPPIGSVSAGFDNAPTFELPRFDSGTVDLEALRDRPIFLYFWASWCTPCRTEAPTIQKLWPEYEARGYMFVGVNILDQDKDARNFLREHGLSFPLVRDTEGSVYLQYGVYGMPESFFINPGLRVQEKYLGELSEEVLRDRLGRLEAPQPRTERVP